MEMALHLVHDNNEATDYAEEDVEGNEKLKYYNDVTYQYIRREALVFEAHSHG